LVSIANQHGGGDQIEPVAQETDYLPEPEITEALVAANQFKVTGRLDVEV
jgi:hypothetical protein